MPGIGFTMASCSAYMIMNGVMIRGVSAGSNQVGASEMWTPQVICPSGAARDGVGVSHVTAERSVASAARTHRFSNGADRLIVISSSRVASFGTSAQRKGTGTREWRDYRACATGRATRRGSTRAIITPLSGARPPPLGTRSEARSEEHTSELQSLAYLV